MGLVSNLKASTWTILIQTDKAQWQKRAIYNSYWFRAVFIGFVLALVSIIYLLLRNQHQRQLNTALQNQQLANFRDLYENAPIGYLTLAADGLITNANELLLSNLGYARDEVVNKLYLKDVVDGGSRAEAEHSQARLRSTDIFARMGGEEFVILLPDTSIDQAVEKAESLRQALAEIVVSLSNGTNVQITVSFGVAALIKHGTDISQVLEAADKALYEAKRSGRNCVKVAT